MPEIAAANSSSPRRIMPEAVLVCAVRLPLLPAPSVAVHTVLTLFSDRAAGARSIVHLVD